MLIQNGVKVYQKLFIQVKLNMLFNSCTKTSACLFLAIYTQNEVVFRQASA